MSPTFALLSQRVLLPDGIRPATIYFSEGKILSVKAYGANDYDCPHTSFGDWVIMPGVIDAHVHINEPGRTDWEGFETATRAAAAGGICTVVDMPLNSSPVTTSPEALEIKRQAAKNKLQINCEFWGGLVPDNVDDIQPLLGSGVLGIKAFLVHSGIDEFPNVSRKMLEKAMPEIAKSGLPLLAHCELELPNEQAKLLQTSPNKYKSWLQSRPQSWEIAAIRQMIELCRETGCRTHIVHLSAAAALPDIRAARAKGLPLTVETCAHYLYFNAEDIADGATEYKCAPPIRDAVNQQLLWEALKNGDIDFVTSDHSPAPPAMKLAGNGSFAESWGGIAGLQFLLPATWTAAQKQGCSLVQLSQWLSGSVAQFLGCSDRKGKIAPGYDADLTIWNPDEEFVVQKEMIRHRHTICPYIGEVLFGVVKKTFVQGKMVFSSDSLE